MTGGFWLFRSFKWCYSGQVNALTFCCAQHPAVPSFMDIFSRTSTAAWSLMQFYECNQLTSINNHLLFVLIFLLRFCIFMSLPCLFILGGCLAVLVLDLVVLIGASSWWLQAPPSGEEGSVQVLRGFIESFVLWKANQAEAINPQRWHICDYQRWLQPLMVIKRWL